MPISEPTAVFSIRDDRDMEIKQAVLQVYRALEEKGYNPMATSCLRIRPISRPTKMHALSFAALIAMICCKLWCAITSKGNIL